MTSLPSMNTIVHLNTRGVEHLKSGRYDEAAADLSRALGISQQLLNVDPPSVSSSWQAPNSRDPHHQDQDSHIQLVALHPVSIPLTASPSMMLPERPPPLRNTSNHNAMERQHHEVAPSPVSRRHSVMDGSTPTVVEDDDTTDDCIMGELQDSSSSRARTPLEDHHQQYEQEIWSSSVGGASATVSGYRMHSKRIFQGAFQLRSIGTIAAADADNVNVSLSGFQNLYGCSVACVYNLALANHLHAITVLRGCTEKGLRASHGAPATAASAAADYQLHKKLLDKASKLYEYAYTLVAQYESPGRAMGLMTLAILNNQILAIDSYGHKALRLKLGWEHLLLSVFMFFQERGTGLLSRGLFKWLWNAQFEAQQDDVSMLFRPIFDTVSRIVLTDPGLSPAA